MVYFILIYKNLGLDAGRSGVRIPGRGKCSLKTTVVDARVNYPLYKRARARVNHHSSSSNTQYPLFPTAQAEWYTCMFYIICLLQYSSDISKLLSPNYCLFRTLIINKRSIQVVKYNTNIRQKYHIDKVLNVIDSI